MDLLFILIGGALVGWLNYYLATRRGRNVIAWAIGGFVFGLFSTLLLLVLGTTREKELADAVELNKLINNQK